MVVMAPKVDRFRAKAGNTSDKIAQKIDIGMLNAIVGYCFKIPNKAKATNGPTLINRRSLTNLRTLFDLLDESLYEHDERLYARFDIIKTALDARIARGIENYDLLVDHCRSDVDEPYNAEIIANLPGYIKLSYEDIKYINNWTSDKLNFAWLSNIKDRFIDVVMRMESGNYKSYKDISEELIEVCHEAINLNRKASNISEGQTIAIGEEGFLERVEEILHALRDPANTLITGIRALNDMLVGGYQSSRLYMYCGLPGGYKSFMLLKSALDIKKYNKTLPKKLGARKTVLMVTMENTVQESVARMLSSTIIQESLKDIDPKEVIKRLKKDNLFKIEGDDDTDVIIKYFPINEISTDDLYTLIDELHDENREIIALVLDYIKRIRPAQYAREEKEQLKNVTNELKNVATFYDIPVITAHQLNRDAANTIDKAVEANREDLGRLMGRANVGSAWEVVENSDWMGLINIEKKRGTEDYYISLKRVKCRYGDNDMDYFNHPFAHNNRIQLIDDLLLEESISELSLASEFEGVDIGRKGKKNAIEREIYENSPLDDIFDTKKAINKVA